MGVVRISLSVPALYFLKMEKDQIRSLMGLQSEMALEPSIQIMNGAVAESPAEIRLQQYPTTSLPETQQQNSAGGSFASILSLQF